jgi:hypothetical protein
MHVAWLCPSSRLQKHTSYSCDFPVSALLPSPLAMSLPRLVAALPSPLFWFSWEWYWNLPWAGSPQLRCGSNCGLAECVPLNSVLLISWYVVSSRRPRSPLGNPWPLPKHPVSELLLAMDLLPLSLTPQLIEGMARWPLIGVQPLESPSASAAIFPRHPSLSQCACKGTTKRQRLANPKNLMGFMPKYSYFFQPGREFSGPHNHGLSDPDPPLWRNGPPWMFEQIPNVSSKIFRPHFVIFTPFLSNLICLLAESTFPSNHPFALPSLRWCSSILLSPLRVLPIVSPNVLQANSNWSMSSFDDPSSSRDFSAAEEMNKLRLMD